MLVPGVVRKGKDDPRLVAFPTTLARTRFAVLVPNLRGFEALRVHSDDAAEVAAAFEFLVSRSDLVPRGSRGMYRKDAAREHLEPAPYPASVFVENSKDALKDPNDRTSIESRAV